MLPRVTVAGYELSSYSVVLFLAIAAGSTLAYLRSVRRFPRWEVTAALCAAILAGYLGALSLQRLVSSSLPGADDAARRGGKTVLGAVVGGAAALLIWARVRRFPAGEVLDQAVVGVPLGQGIGRVGCLLAGCCAGRPTSSWLGVHLPDNQGSWCLRYPTQMLSSAADFAILTVLLLVERRYRERSGLPFPGFLAALYAVLFSAKRLLIEPLREGGPPVVGPLTWAQVTSLIMLVLAAFPFLQHYRPSKKDNRNQTDRRAERE